MKKRILSLILTAAVAGTVLSGCASSKPAEKPAEKVTLTYANWNLGAKNADTLERRMVKAWNDSHPNIQVQIDESLDYSKYEDSLTAAAAAGKLDDVVMLPNIQLGLTNEWLADISQYTAKDAEWAKIAKPLEQATHYGKGVYAVPAGLYFMGYFVNDDLFQKYNADSLSFAPKYDDFINAVKTMNKPSEGIVGLSEEVQFPEWYPASVDKSLGWFTFDGAKYNLDKPAFAEAVNKAKEIFNNKYVYDGLTDKQKAVYNAKYWGDVWKQGKMAVAWDGTWALGDYSKLNFKSRFISVPGGRTPVVGDFMAVTKSSAHSKEAYEFAKYMSFSKEGILKRMELGKDGSYTSLPVTTDKDVLDQYFKQNTYEGLKDAFDSVNNGIVEGVKVVPGYIASRWTAQTGMKVAGKDNANIGDVIFNTSRGNVKIEDVAGQLNKLANDNYTKAAQSMKALTEK